jgi:hypothetical protein
VANKPRALRRATIASSRALNYGDQPLRTQESHEGRLDFLPCGSWSRRHARPGDGRGQIIDRCATRLRIRIRRAARAWHKPPGLFARAIDDSGLGGRAGESPYCNLHA